MSRSPERGGVLRALLVVVGVLVLLAIAGVVGFQRYLKSKYEPALQAYREKAGATVDGYCSEAEKLAADPFFHQARTHGDAAAVLNGWVAWENGKGSPVLPAGSPLTVPPGLPQTSRDMPDWLTRELDLSKLDFSWMEKLHAYDYWTITDFPGRSGAKFTYLEMRLPWFVSLQTWAKFRLRAGIARKEPLPAARDVRQLAWLSYRSDSLIGAMVAVAILKLERDAHDAHPELAEGWSPMEPAQLERMKQVMWGATNYAHVVAGAEVARKSRTCATPPVGACVGLSEAAGFAKYLEPLVRGELEPSYQELEKALAETDCPAALGKTAWRDGNTLMETPEVARDLGATTEAANVPFLGKYVVGNVLLSMTMSTDKMDWFATKKP